MELSKILRPEAVKVFASVTSKKRMFQEIGEIAESCYGLDTSRTVEALSEREGLGPTGVGHGVALPHARLGSLDRVVGVFVMLTRPLDFGAVDRQPVDLAFTLLAPEESGVEHLKALALVSRTLREASLCSKLRANPEASKLYTLLTEPHSMKAA